VGGRILLSSFRRLVAELGIVGKSEESSGADSPKPISEYAMPDRLVITNDDECAIHPMFYSKLQVQKNGYIVYPFPDHEDYKDLV
jgi:hypothetical protein